MLLRIDSLGIEFIRESFMLALTSLKAIFQGRQVYSGGNTGCEATNIL